MKRISAFLVLAVLTVVTFTACVNDDYLANSEADITEAKITADSLLSIKPTIEDFKITFRLKEISEDYVFAPEFKLTPGATISPASGTERDFTSPQTYTVTSEDGDWSKTYTVSFIIDMPNFVYDYELAEEDPDNHYHTFYTFGEDGQKVYDWGSGNLGFSLTLSLTGQEKVPSAYPTMQIDNGYEGKGVKLVTLTTGSLGAAFGAPLASGNLFIGDFIEVNPTDPRLGLNFGRPYKNSKPVALKGFYKYKAGDEFKVNNAPSQLTEDTWDAYAVLFEKEDQNNFLRGDFSFDDPRIVAVARLDHSNGQYGETDQWTEFTIPFNFKEGKSFDITNDYMYTVVFAASKEGNVFNGAEGSTLWIDEVELVSE